MRTYVTNRQAATAIVSDLDWNRTPDLRIYEFQMITSSYGWFGWRSELEFATVAQQCPDDVDEASGRGS
jgi:hypothetical protein